MEKKRKRRIVWIVLILLLVAAAVVYMLVKGGGREVVVNARAATTDDIEITVMATGYIQPVEKVEIGTQVSGIVEKIYVDFNSVVKKNDLLAELDKLTLMERLNQAKASVTSAKSDYAYAQASFDRTQRLYEGKATTLVSYQEAQNRLVQAQTSLTNAQANYDQAMVNLSYARIVSPIDGVVLQRAVEEGQTVAASFNTPTLFIVANDLKRMQVEADVDEADIGRVSLGQRVRFDVDAYPGEEFQGTVEQIRLQPVVNSNVVTYTVIIEAPNPDEKLFPGMTANVTIIAQEESGIAIPVEATTFTMRDEIRAALGISAEKDAAPADGSALRGGEPGAGGRERGAKASTVWVRRDNKYERREITTGLSDNVNIVVRSGLAEGEEVVLSAAFVKKDGKGQAAANPLVPQRRR